MSYFSNKPFERMDSPARPRRRPAQMDNLTLDAMAAQCAGMTYGQFKALPPEEQEIMREKARQTSKGREQEKADEDTKGAPRSRSRTGEPLIYKKTCPMCGQKFESPTAIRLYCSRDCKRKMSRMREAAKKEDRHGQE